MNYWKPYENIIKKIKINWSSLVVHNNVEPKLYIHMKRKIKWIP